MIIRFRKKSQDSLSTLKYLRKINQNDIGTKKNSRYIDLRRPTRGNAAHCIQEPNKSKSKSVRKWDFHEIMNFIFC